MLDEAIGYSAPSDTTPSAHATPVEDEVVAPTPQAPQPSFVDTIPPPGHELSYENYTRFPLTGGEYRHECGSYMAKMQSMNMPHGAYWNTLPHGLMDVAHHDAVPDTVLPESAPIKVCSKTITYQLDGWAGLVADLALMAQVAAFAREVSRPGNSTGNAALTDSSSEIAPSLSTILTGIVASQFISSNISSPAC